MLTFLEETILSIQKKHENIADLTLVLPSKRAGGFIKSYLRKHTIATTFLPEILSIEEFIETLSDLTIIDPTELVFKSYEAYLQIPSISEKDDFETFSSWIVTLLGDFNEIDRFLVPQQKFFTYLSSIQDMNHWYVRDEKTPLIQNYLSFWNSLPSFYENLIELLLNEGCAYQGYVYRKAAEDIEHYIAHNPAKKHVFIGFNALNKAEQRIIQELLEAGHTDVYWDTDSHFYEDPNHSAALFIKSYQKDWKYFANHPLTFIANNYSGQKTYRFVEAQKHIAQAKYLGQLLSQLSQEQLNSTAVVLADESLLHPVLNSLPQNVQGVNITMGASLRMFPATIFFEQLLTLHQNPTQVLYYKDVQGLLNHPLAAALIPNAHTILAYITQHNITHLSSEKLIEISESNDAHILELLFGHWQNKSSIAIKNCLSILLTVKEAISGPLEKTVLHQLYQVFSSLAFMSNSYPHLKTIKTLRTLFSELIVSTHLDFEGDAFSGLQIMGVLETRVLDFKHVILLSVNEGVLPSGKSNTSFITYDLKLEFGLPMFTEKDAIYSYHFYRLLHRAEHVTFLYNNLAEGLNSGEKSRFLRQLEIEKLPAHSHEKVVLSPTVSVQKTRMESISKTKEVMERLAEIAQKGFSPSALTSYIRNPLDFYYQKIIKVNEFQEVEETVAFNTLGTIVHDALQTFYEPLENTLLTVEILRAMKLRIEEEVTRQFKITFKGGTFDRGKNLIIFEVTKRYISNLIDLDISEVKKGNTIEIVQIETDLRIDISIPELDFPVYIGGKVDRVDRYNGQLRIIDYKTGLVKQPDIEIVDWSEITQDYKYSKAVQVLAYALMIEAKMPVEGAAAGIISFKNLNSGFLKLGIKEAPGSRNKIQELNNDIIANFTTELKRLIIEICDPSIPFTEKEV